MPNNSSHPPPDHPNQIWAQKPDGAYGWMPRPKPLDFGEWRYYAHWHSGKAWAHRCGPRGGASAPIWVRKTTPLKDCPKCGASVPKELQGLMMVQKLKSAK
jgi:hypothetical protein